MDLPNLYARCRSKLSKGFERMGLLKRPGNIRYLSRITKPIRKVFCFFSVDEFSELV